MNWLVFGSDPDRPGAGVASVEQVRADTSGGKPPAKPIGRPRDCEVYETPSISNSLARSLGGDVDGDTSPNPVSAGSMEVGLEYYVGCTYTDDDSLAYLDSFVYEPSEPAAGPRADAIARQVYAEVPLVFPTPHMSPPVDATQLVGLPIWLWVDDTVWRNFDASASVAGVTVTVVAEPSHTTWDMGDGTILTCDGPGTPWASGKGKTDCSHTYQFVSDDQPDGRYPGAVTVTWSVSWSANTGESGALPTASRTTSFDLDVRQRQAVITYGQ